LFAVNAGGKAVLLKIKGPSDITGGFLFEGRRSKLVNEQISKCANGKISRVGNYENAGFTSAFKLLNL
jgi:hypothetical protein